jgi:3',5'-cyclic AMP phosphodiesterase CpdA
MIGSGMRKAPGIFGWSLVAIGLFFGCSRPGLLEEEGRITLRFDPDSTFTIVQFTDTQDDQDIDPRTVALMEAVLDDRKPDLVVFTGDNIRSGPQTPEDVLMAIHNIADPVESRDIPWLVTFGNHDEDHTPDTGVDEEAMLEAYMAFPNNINMASPRGVHGTGNMQVLILGSQDEAPVANIWALDSGRYAESEIGGQLLEGDGLPGWDVIRPSQLSWYFQTSQTLEERYGGVIPSLMFFHIPLWEFDLLWEHRERHEVVGEKNEDVSSGPFNSGLFAAMLERGDVMGVFVGHDHVNDYVGDYFGIRLGYSANTGFGTYGLDGDERDRMRGARVFVLHESAPGRFQTQMVYASEYGI